MPATQMNTRIDEALKRSGDEVLAKCGYSPSQAIRALWTYVVQANDVPSFMKEWRRNEFEAERHRRLACVREGSGSVRRMAQELGLLAGEDSPSESGAREVTPDEHGA